ncbi:MAG: cytochrome c oxidase subunit 3 family protein [Acidobacteria bacterium]|nr:cytochrome c oxidase subunit 3 family protein [Acidobacteriota bacterium]
MEQQFDASKIGMWLFLATEILLFGGLFVGFGIMQARHTEAFIAGHHHLDWQMGALNTCFLLISSFTMVMAVWAASNNKNGNKQKVLITNLLLTLGFAGGFMVVKYFEYSHKFHDGLLPGKFFHYTGPDLVPNMFVFFSFYFMMTGLHGFHVLGGMGAITYLIIRSIKGDYTSEYFTPVDLIGLYWHLVDLIWIYLFPLLYLIS